MVFVIKLILTILAVVLIFSCFEIIECEPDNNKGRVKIVFKTRLPFATIYHRQVLDTRIINKNGKELKTVLRKKYFFLKILLIVTIAWVINNIDVIVSNILVSIYLNNLLVFIISCMLAFVSSIIALVFALMAKKKTNLSRAGFKIFGVITLVFTCISLLLTKFF